MTNLHFFIPLQQSLKLLLLNYISMKKVLLFVFVALFATTGFAQQKLSLKDALKNPVKKHVQPRLEAAQSSSAVNFLPLKAASLMAIEETEIGQTTYDWATNCGLRNQVTTWSDGMINAVYTKSAETGFADRGTGMATFDGTEWAVINGKIEPNRTGWGSVAKYGENGLVIAAHTASGVDIFTTDDRTGNGTWVQHTLPSSVAIAWPRVSTSGPNNSIIHVLAGFDAEYMGQTSPILYFRTSDGGETWDFSERVLEQLDANHSPGYGSDTYCFIETTENNRISFIVADGWSDGLCLYSDDNGETWESITFFDHPDPFTSLGENIMFYPRWVSGAWDANNKLHIAYEYNATTGEFTSGSYYPGLGGVAYWNQDMPVADSAYINQNLHSTSYFYSDATGTMPNEYIGYLPPMDEEGNLIDPYEAGGIFIEDLTLHGSYNCGIVAMPSLIIDKATGNICVIFVALHQLTDDGSGNSFYRVFARGSKNGGESWEPMVLLTQGFMHQYSECVFPAASATVVDGKVTFIVQIDTEIGTFVQSDESTADDNYYSAFTIDLVQDVIGINEHNQIAETIEMEIYPNPVKEFANIALDKEAEVTIYNAVGQSVKTFHHNGGIVNVDLSNLETGVYFVTANSGNAINTQKFIVTK